VSEVLDGRRRFALTLRLAERYRDRPEAIEKLWVKSPDGAYVPLSEVAQIAWVNSPPAVSRENAQRRIVVQSNVLGRDMGSFVQEAQAAVAAQVDLPPGYTVVWGGQFENQQRAQRTLAVVVPLCLATILLLLYLALGTLRSALLILLNAPFALIGGVFALALSGQYLSVPSSVGFIVLLGVAVQNGLVLISHIQDRQREGAPLHEAIREGAVRRLRPILMTATCAGLGLVPLLLSSGVGSEVQRPLATVVLGGLASCTVLTLLVIPALYPWVAAGDGQALRPQHREETFDEPEPPVDRAVRAAADSRRSAS